MAATFTVTVTCPQCEGLGFSATEGNSLDDNSYIPSGYYIHYGCGHCGGGGGKTNYNGFPYRHMVPRGFKKGSGKIGIEYEVCLRPCEYCASSGRRPDGKTCQACLGKGRELSKIRSWPIKPGFW